MLYVLQSRAVNHVLQSREVLHFLQSREARSASCLTKWSNSWCPTKWSRALCPSKRSSASCQVKSGLFQISFFPDHIIVIVWPLLVFCLGLIAQRNWPMYRDSNIRLLCKYTWSMSFLSLSWPLQNCRLMSSLGRLDFKPDWKGWIY